MNVFESDGFVNFLRSVLSCAIILFFSEGTDFGNSFSIIRRVLENLLAPVDGHPPGLDIALFSFFYEYVFQQVFTIEQTS